MTNDRRAAAHQDNAAAPRQISSDFSQFTYPHLLRLQASVRPDAPAIVTPARAMTWRQLDEEAGRLGAALLSLGVAQADKVGILMPNCCEWAAWAYGAAGIGATVERFGRLDVCFNNAGFNEPMRFLDVPKKGFLARMFGG